MLNVLVNHPQIFDRSKPDVPCLITICEEYIYTRNVKLPIDEAQIIMACRSTFGKATEGFQRYLKAKKNQCDSTVRFRVNSQVFVQAYTMCFIHLYRREDVAHMIRRLHYKESINDYVSQVKCPNEDARNNGAVLSNAVLDILPEDIRLLISLFG